MNKDKFARTTFRGTCSVTLCGLVSSQDSEAHLKSWIEMICNLMQLFHQLSDEQYQALLPTIFNCVNQLVCYCQDVHLREALGQWIFRIGKMYHLAPPGLNCEPVIQHRWLSLGRTRKGGMFFCHLKKKKLSLEYICPCSQILLSCFPHITSCICDKCHVALISRRASVTK